MVANGALSAAGFLALAAIFFAAGVALQRANQRGRAARRDLLSECASLLNGATVSIAPSGFGVLRGRFAGRPAALTPIAEALAFRKLPQLWLAAALADEDPARASIVVIRRPGDADAFVGGTDLPMTVRPSADWPQDTVIRASAGAAPLLRAIEAALAPAFADPKLKAVTVGPRGVRVVRQAAQGARGSYLLFRDSRFELETISPEDARASLDLAAALADRIRADDRSETRDAA